MAAAAAADPMLHDALPVAPVFIAPPSYETTLAMATTTIAILPSLHPHPNHSSIRALERDLFDKLQAIQSSQSEEWGFRGLAEQPAEYALKSATPWTDAPNPGPHRPVGLNAQLTRDAETIFDSAKMDYLSQLNVTQAIINALNVAVPKEFKGGATAMVPSWEQAHTPTTIILAPSFLPSGTCTGAHHPRRNKPTTAPSPLHGTRRNQSKHISIALKTAMSLPSSHPHHSPWHR